MPDVLRRSRSLAIALVVLALSAGVAFATAPVFRPVSGPAAGTQAEEPDANENEQGENEQGEDPGEQGEDAEQGDDADTPDEVEQPEAPEAPDAEDGTPAVGTHGELVSTAAQMETPAGFANHGAFVSCVAKMKDVKLADVEWATVTPEACAAAKGAAKAERDAAKAERKAQHAAKVHDKRAEKQAEHAAAGH